MHMGLELIGKPGLLDVSQVVDGVLGARQDEHIKAGEGVTVVEVAEGDAGLVLQGVEVGVVGDVGQPEDADLQGIWCRMRAGGGLAPQGDAVLFGEGQVRHERQDSQDGAPGAFGDEVDPLPEELGVAPELVDDEPGQEAALGGGEQVVRTDGGGEDPAPVDVRHQEYHGPGPLGHGKVHQIVFFEI